MSASFRQRFDTGEPDRLSATRDDGDAAIEAESIEIHFNSPFRKFDLERLQDAQTLSTSAALPPRHLALALAAQSAVASPLADRVTDIFALSARRRHSGNKARATGERRLRFPHDGGAPKLALLSAKTVLHGVDFSRR